MSRWSRYQQPLEPETQWVEEEHPVDWVDTVPHQRPAPEPIPDTPTRISGSLPVSTSPIPTPPRVRETVTPSHPPPDDDAIRQRLTSTDLLRSIDRSTHRTAEAAERSAEADAASVAMASALSWWLRTAAIGCLSVVGVLVLAGLVAAIVFLLLRP